jgi:hypothetical protein
MLKSGRSYAETSNLVYKTTFLGSPIKRVRNTPARRQSTACMHSVRNSIINMILSSQKRSYYSIITNTIHRQSLPTCSHIQGPFCNVALKALSSGFEYFGKPTASFNQSNAVLCHTKLFSGFRTQWFSSGKLRSLLFTPRVCSTLKTLSPSETGRR